MFKKMLITMLVMLVATSAMAGEGMDWKFYGKLHTSIDFLNDGNDSQIYLASNTSRFGFKGGTELNENFYFMWQFESAVNIAQKGEETLATRNSYVGVKGNWGKFFGGIHDTPFKMLGRKVEYFKDELGDFRHATMGWDRRLQDVIAYATPDLSGFKAVLAYQFDQGGSDKMGWDEEVFGKYQAATAFSGMAAYAKDDFFVGVAYESLGKGYDDEFDMEPDPTDEAESQTGVRAAAKWDNGGFGVSALYQSLSNVFGEKDWKSNTFGLEAIFRFSEAKWAAKGSYFTTNPYTDAEDDDTTPDIDESKVTGSWLALGIDHTVTDAVKFYIQYVMAMNNDAIWFGVGGTDLEQDGERFSANGHGAWVHPAMNDDGTYKNPNGFSIGTVVKF